jgi:hypothetical protein
VSRHEIDIEGLPEGWTPVSLKSGLPCENGAILPDGTATVMCTLIVRRKVRKYDHKKTLPDVLVTSLSPDDVFLLQKKCVASLCRIADVWQPNIAGICPVDPEASIVRVRVADGTFDEALAAKFIWTLDGEDDDITAWQFIRLADGWEW